MRVAPILLAALLCAASSHSLSRHSLAAEKPNFIVINIDDLGYADIGPYGAKNATPNLDRLADEGLKLTSHYAAPVCSPSRAALMTGCYPKRALPIPGVLFPAAEVGLNPKELTVAELLKEVGYATACVGKWHLGDQPEFLPTQQGFDYYYGLPYSNDMGPPEEGAKSNFGQPVRKRKAEKDATTKKSTAKAREQRVAETGITGTNQPPLPLVENRTVVERVRGEEQATLTRRYTEKAVGFIHDNKDKPFFLYLPHSAVHFPMYPGEDFRGRSSIGLRGDWIQEVDWSVGQIVDAVRNAGLESRTLILFTSDNGGPLNQEADNHPLRGGKGSTLEGGIRTCTIAWWPGKVPAGKSTRAMTSMMDVLPTLVNLAGRKVPADRKIDGVDIWPLLSSGDEAQGPRDTFYCFRGLKLEAVRSGPWKLHLKQGELYNLHDDIGEARNVAAQHPDQVERLERLAREMEGDLGTDGVGPGCRPLGRVKNPQPLMTMEGKVRSGFEPR
ncbi:MAG: sulfatase [Planctomycetota bacterium]